MRFFIAAAAIATLITAASAPALADMGGTVKQNGQCWKPAKTMDGGTFGYFGACPEGAAAPATVGHNTQSQPIHKHAH